VHRRSDRWKYRSESRDSPSGIELGELECQDDKGAAVMDESSNPFPATATVAEPNSLRGTERGVPNGEQAQDRRSGEPARRPLAHEIRELIRENSALRAENTTLQHLCRDYLSAKQRLDRLSSFLEDIFGRGVWDFIRKAKRIRMRLRREGTITGRFWRAGTRLLKRSIRMTAKTTALVRAPVRIGRRWSGFESGAASHQSSVAHDRDAGASRCATTYHELPWRRIGDSAGCRMGHRGHYKILLIAPDQDGADQLPALLRFVELVARCRDFDCRIVLEGRGAVSDAFARLIPTLDVETLVERGIARAHAPGLIAGLFQQWASHRVVIVSSAATGDFFSAFLDRGIAVIPWLVETNPPAGSSGDGGPDWGRSLCRCVSAIGPAGMSPESAARRFGLDSGRIRLIWPQPGGKSSSSDSDWLRFHRAFLRILKAEYDYHPSRELKVSVIVPNYNHAPYLEERLRSIFAQTDPPHEILFLDDASSDESVAVARRLAVESPAPFHMILNETNSGSTFRQWLKGIDLASGDLVWIAESDDACRPAFLERLVPEFFDPTVTLAYCQSASIGPDGQKHADDYLWLTNEISLTHWRHPYSVPGLDEVELALSQRNTIPNASAMLFRKRASLACRADLEWMRLAGDWLFYATQIHGGRISFVPEALNSHRHHERTVRHAFERALELVHEQLHVKAQIFEDFSISARAISRSVSTSVAEYVYRARSLGLDWPLLTSQPRLEPLLKRIRSALRARQQPPRDLRILMVFSGTDRPAGQEAAVRLANALAESFHVFLCSARPWMPEPEVDERITRLEGTLSMTFWSWDKETRPDGTVTEAASSRRAEIIGELIRLHRIDVIHSRGWWADRLVASVHPDPRIPWFLDLRDADDYREDARSDPDFERLSASLLSMIRGVFYSDPDDLVVLPAISTARLGQVMRIFDAFDPGAIRPGGDRSSKVGGSCDRAPFLTAEAYLAAVNEPESRWSESPQVLRTA
jgi:glycosyltransferase involved in cell wall biosynthesis